MVIGELGNLAAYGFAPAAIVTPMGAVGVVCNLFITTMILKEKCNIVNIAGIVCVISGIVLIVVFAPRTNIDITSDSVVQQYILTNQMGFYLIMWTTLFVMMLPLCKRFGEKSVAIYVATGSVVASLTIVSAKVFSSLVTRGVTQGFDQDWISPVPYLALLFLVTTAVGSMHFINMAMMKFGNSQVIPVYYAMFTTASVGSVGFVFREFSCMNTVGQAVVFVIGIILAVAGVCLVQFQFKDAAEGEDEDVGKNGNANEEDEEGSRCDGPQNPVRPEP
jgi:drug/metabolite transporter (DMT)-like permease